jgi:hypothetical protein
MNKENNKEKELKKRAKQWASIVTKIIGYTLSPSWHKRWLRSSIGKKCMEIKQKIQCKYVDIELPFADNTIVVRCCNIKKRNLECVFYETGEDCEYRGQPLKIELLDNTHPDHPDYDPF